MIRIVGLSATLPNYIDVARFLRVNCYSGLFFFDGRFRPVPLSQSFVGVKSLSRIKQMKDMEEICYEKVLSNISKGYQVQSFFNIIYSHKNNTFFLWHLVHMGLYMYSVNGMYAGDGICSCS